MKRKPSRAKRTPRPAEAPAPEASPAARSRRDFMRLLVAGTAAALAAPAAVAAEEKKPATDPARQRRARTETPRPGTHPMVPAELEKQKKALADSLKVIRAYSIPAGSAPAYVFRPLKAARTRRSRP